MVHNPWLAEGPHRGAGARFRPKSAPGLTRSASTLASLQARPGTDDLYTMSCACIEVVVKTKRVVDLLFFWWFLVPLIDKIKRGVT